MSRQRALAVTASAVAVPLLAIRMLHGMGGDPRVRLDLSAPMQWIGDAQPIDAVAAVLRVVGLVVAYYVLSTTVVYLAALATGNRRVISMIRPLAFPIVRSVADRVVAGTIAVSALATPLLGSTIASSPVVDVYATEVTTGYVPDVYRPDVYQPDVYRPDVHRLLEPTRPTGTDQIMQGAYVGRPTTPGPDPDPPSPAPVDPDPTDNAGDERPNPLEGSLMTVQPGDSLWSIAETRLTVALGRSPDDHETAPYWRRLIEDNMSKLRSGNPDLIFPGEQLDLPDPDT